MSDTRTKRAMAVQTASYISTAQEHLKEAAESIVSGNDEVAEDALCLAVTWCECAYKAVKRLRKTK